MIGIEFTLKDGTKDHYDPVDYPNDFKETETHYILSLAHDYKIAKSEVESIRHYELCICGYELYPDGCRNYSCETNKG